MLNFGENLKIAIFEAVNKLVPDKQTQIQTLKVLIEIFSHTFAIPKPVTDGIHKALDVMIKNAQLIKEELPQSLPEVTAKLEAVLSAGKKYLSETFEKFVQSNKYKISKQKLEESFDTIKRILREIYFDFCHFMDKMLDKKPLETDGADLENALIKPQEVGTNSRTHKGISRVFRRILNKVKRIIPESWKS